MHKIQYPKVTFIDVIKVFWRGVKPEKWRFFSLIASLIVVNILISITPIFYRDFFDILAGDVSRRSIAPQLIKLIIFIGLLNLGVFVLFRIATVVNATYQLNAIARLKQQSYDYLMSHSYSFFSNNFTGSLVQRVNRFARAFERLSDRLLWDVMSLIVKMLSIFIVILFINKVVAFLILFWAILFLLFNIVFSTWKLKYDIKVAEADSKATAYLADTISNQNTVQLFSGFKHESLGYKKVTDEQAKKTRFAWNLDNIIFAGQHFLGIVIEFVLFYFAIRYWEQGIVTVGIFVLFQVYLFDLIHKLWDFGRVVRDFYQGYADAKEMTEMLMLPHEIKNIPMATELEVAKGEIEFRDLDFSFNETRKVLESVNLIIEPSQRVALIGPSGAGKTTFVRLLLRLYVPSQGKILIDGQDIQKVTQESLRKNIAMVPQDPILFHRTLAENIAYGKPGASIQEIERVAQLAHCDEFIKNLPLELQTFVGERGIKLSGGERQRIAIARAILKNAPILVLDEATSSLDSHSELLIQDALNTLMKGRTTIVIAHRLSTIQKMDRIIVVDNGKIVEDGNHAELLAQKGSLYRKLWTLQAGGFLADENDDIMDEEIKSAPKEAENQEE
ncbi:MAG: ABC transporter ATP-binding protein [bacterium]|nr:ABC transporter ATP-binding protein [bacterium]